MRLDGSDRSAYDYKVFIDGRLARMIRFVDDETLEYGYYLTERSTYVHTAKAAAIVIDEALRIADIYTIDPDPFGQEAFGA